MQQLLRFCTQQAVAWAVVMASTVPHNSCLHAALVSGNADKPSQPAHTRQLKRVAAPEQQAEAGLALAGAAGYADAGPAAFMPSFLHHEMPAQQHLPAGDATLAEYTEAAPVGQAKPRRKRASKASRSQDGFDSCSFCSTTESPLWRNGPAQYPRLCNACGIRYTRHATGKTGPRTNPFSAKILASLHKKVRILNASLGCQRWKHCKSTQPCTKFRPSAAGHLEPNLNLPSANPSGTPTSLPCFHGMLCMA